MGVSWVCHGCVMGVSWICYGCVMGVLWMCYGCVMDVLWVCYGCVMDVLWMCYGCVMGVKWLCYRCVMGGCFMGVLWGIIGVLWVCYRGRFFEVTSCLFVVLFFSLWSVSNFSSHCGKLALCIGTAHDLCSYALVKYEIWHSDRLYLVRDNIWKYAN